MASNKKEDFIVILSAVPFPYGSASDNIIYTFMSGFNEQGCKGEVICLYPNLPSKYSDVLPEGVYDGVIYRYLCGRTGGTGNKITNYLNRKVLPYFLFKKYLRNKTKEYSVTVIFVTHIRHQFYKVSQICHNLGAKVVFTACEYPELLIDRTPENKSLFRDYSKYIDKYIFETKTLKDYYEEALKKKVDGVIVPPTMIFDDIVKAVKDDCAPYIAYCGSIHSEEKDGLSNIILAFCQFHSKYPDVILKFVGKVSKPQYFQKLKDLVASLGVEECVVFTGEVTRQEYVKELINAKLLLVAKPKSSYYGGGLSSKVIEYLFSGNPVMMVDSDDYVYYLTHKQNVFFVGDNEPETLSTGLNVLFDSPDLMKNIGEQGKSFAESHFNYHVLCKELLTYILTTNV